MTHKKHSRVKTREITEEEITEDTVYFLGHKPRVPVDKKPQPKLKALPNEQFEEAIENTLFSILEQKDVIVRPAVTSNPGEKYWRVLKKDEEIFRIEGHILLDGSAIANRVKINGKDVRMGYWNMHDLLNKVIWKLDSQGKSKIQTAKEQAAITNFLAQFQK